MNSKTFTLRESDIDRHWYVVDATDQTLGRLASRIARVLEGKNKPEYTPNLDSGDHVIVLNAARVAVTRDKRETKLYIRHSGYPRGLRGEDIPLGARVFAVVDAFDAMTFDRPYSKAITFDAAKTEIKRCAGTHFDPGVVEAFLRVPAALLDEIRRRSVQP